MGKMKAVWLTWQGAKTYQKWLFPHHQNSTDLQEIDQKIKSESTPMFRLFHIFPLHLPDIHPKCAIASEWGPLQCTLSIRKPLSWQV